MQRRDLLAAAFAGAAGGIAGCLTPPVASDERGELDDPGESDDPDEPDIPDVPDVVADGSVDTDAVVERTRDAMDSESYRLEITTRIVDEGESVTSETLSIAVDRSTSRVVFSIVQEAADSPTQRQDSYRTAEGGIDRLQVDDQIEYHETDQAFDAVEGDLSAVFVQQINPSMEAHAFGEPEWDVDLGAFVSTVDQVKEGYDSFEGSSGELQFDPDGVLVGLSLGGIETDGGEAQLEVSVGEVGTATVDEPDWLEEDNAPAPS